jgi:hypothetical protein
MTSIHQYQMIVAFLIFHVVTMSAAAAAAAATDSIHHLALGLCVSGNTGSGKAYTIDLRQFIQNESIFECPIRIDDVEYSAACVASDDEDEDDDDGISSLMPKYDSDRKESYYNHDHPDYGKFHLVRYNFLDEDESSIISNDILNSENNNIAVQLTDKHGNSCCGGKAVIHECSD